MKIELKYFTGTGNSLKIIKTCNALLKDHEVNYSPITHSAMISNDNDIIGFCFPVYAFDIPRICTNYLRKLKPFSKRQKSFIIINAGDKDESGFAVKNCIKILEKKNCEIIYSAVVEMPINWITYMNPPSQKEAETIITYALDHTKQIISDILENKTNYHTFNIPKRYGAFGLYKEYLLFKYLGIKNLWRMFRTYDSCSGCGLCSDICPVSAIKINNKKPEWNSNCEQCMRCVNFCPREAIYQKGSDTKGRNRYHEPDFKPERK